MDQNTFYAIVKVTKNASSMQVMYLKSIKYLFINPLRCLIMYWIPWKHETLLDYSMGTR